MDEYRTNQEIRKKKKVVADILKTRNNNLSLSKFMNACFVIISHAYPLCLGKESGDFLVSLSNGQLGLGGLAEGIFFFSMGYLSLGVLKKQNCQEIFLCSKYTNISTITICCFSFYYCL